MTHKGIQFLINDSGNKTAVVLDLKHHRRLWEDMYDRLLVESRASEPRESLDQVKKRLGRKWKRRNG
jgi:hypothetical protein